MKAPSAMRALFMDFYVVGMSFYKLIMRFHDDVFDLVGMRDLLEEKLFTGPRRLYLQIPVIQKGGDDSRDIYGDVLDF